MLPLTSYSGDQATMPATTSEQSTIISRQPLKPFDAWFRKTIETPFEKFARYPSTLPLDP